MTLLTYFNNDKSKYFNTKYSLSMSSSSGSLLSGVESISSTSFPSLSSSSDICAVFIITLFPAVALSCVTSNAASTSLYDGFVSLIGFVLSKAFNKLLSDFSFDKYLFYLHNSIYSYKNLVSYAQETGFISSH